MLSKNTYIYKDKLHNFFNVPAHTKRHVRAWQALTSNILDQTPTLNKNNKW